MVCSLPVSPSCKDGVLQRSSLQAAVGRSRMRLRAGASNSVHATVAQVIRSSPCNHRQHIQRAPMDSRMIHRQPSLRHHRFTISQAQWVGDVLAHAQQHHIQRIVQPLQNLGDPRCKRRSWRQCPLHRVAKAFSSASNFSSPALMRQSPLCSVPPIGMLIVVLPA